VTYVTQPIRRRRYITGITKFEPKKSRAKISLDPAKNALPCAILT